MAVSLRPNERVRYHGAILRRDGAAPAVETPPSAPATTQADLATYRSGLARVQAILEAEKALPLQEGSESRLLAHPTPPPKGTVVMLHGFSAGPWQFEDMAKAVHERGYNVYIPRLPGHGFKLPGGAEDATKLLTSRNWQEYHAYAEEIYAQAKGLGGPVRLLGLSGGANVALDMVTHHPDIKGAVLYAPFLAPKSGAARAGLAVVRFLDSFTFGLFGRLLDKLPFGWGEGGRAAAREWGRPGHWDMKMGNVYGLYRHGQTLVRDAGKIRVPLQFFTTAIDDAADQGAIKKVYERSGAAARNGLYFFPKAEGVPHPMVHWRENGRRETIARLTKLTLEFLEHGKKAIR